MAIPNCKRDWVIIDGGDMTEVNGNVQYTINENYNNLDMVLFRVLGTDYTSFSYSTLPLCMWHNNGTYEILCICFNVAGEFVGYGRCYVIDKIESSFTIQASGNWGNCAFAYKLK